MIKMSTKKLTNPFLSQTNFPRLWTMFQYFAGGTLDKRMLCKIYYKNQTNILEVGCSTGNIAQAFVKNRNINYTGIDVDNAAIQYAKHSFLKKTNFRFLHIDLRDFKRETTKRYDYILFAGIIHHIDDSMAIKLLNTAIGLLSDDGIVVVVEPVLPEKNDPKFIHYYMKLEQGAYVRSAKKMLMLIKSVSGLSLENATTQYVNATPFNFPVCAKFGVYQCKKSN
jgi:2-polyprenyl-3-methyl-5-hydroxy-6-metoxy-1,4-benzoquinol methylase